MNPGGLRVPLGELMLERGGSTDPTKHPDENFILYSIPAYDVGRPETLDGSEIGSAKKNVQAGDVLLSRIVPHIRRSWIVGEHANNNIIASGEWIVFRDERFDPSYLRHFLLSDPFHVQFMQTVAGVGGSLLRARPDHVGRIDVHLPPLDEQKRIAGILDKADALRAKRRQAIALLDSLTQSIFLEMFGDPVSNPKGFPVVEFGSMITSGPTNGLYKPASAYGEGTRILRINNFYDGAIVDQDELRRLAVTPKELETYPLSENDIIINRVNSREYLGKSALVPPLDEPVVFESNMMRLSLDESKIIPKYCIDFLQSRSIKQQIAQKAKDAVNQSSINQSDVKSLKIMLPPIAMQRKYSRVVLANQDLFGIVNRAIAKGDHLFASLQHCAFCGQL